MGRLREATITMAVLLLTTTLMLILLHTLRIIVEEAVEWRIITYVSFAVCLWGIAAEAVLIYAAQKRLAKMMTAWVIMAGMRAFCHCAIAIAMLSGEQSYPTVIICCYMFAFAFALVLATWRACVFARVLHGGKGEIDDYGYNRRTVPFSERLNRLMPLAPNRVTATGVRQEDSIRRAGGGTTFDTMRSLPAKQQRDVSASSVAFSASSMEPGDSASSTHSSYSDDPKLEETTSTESSPVPMVHVPPREVHGTPKQRQPPLATRSVVSPRSSHISKESSVARTSSKSINEAPRRVAPSASHPGTRAVRRQPTAPRPSSQRPLRGKPGVPRRSPYSRRTTISNMKIDDSENDRTLATIISEYDPLSRQDALRKTETSITNEDENPKPLTSQMDVLHRITKHASQDKVNSKFDELKRAVQSPNICISLKDAVSSTNTSASQSDSDDSEHNLKLPDNSDIKLKQQVSQSKVSNIIAGYEEKSQVVTTKSKLFNNKLLRDKVLKEDSTSLDEQLSSEFTSRDTKRLQLLAKASKNETLLMNNQTKMTRSDSKLFKQKQMPRARQISAGRITTSEQSKANDKSYMYENKMSLHKRESLAGKMNTSQKSEVDKSPLVSPPLGSPSHSGDTSAANFKLSDTTPILEKVKHKLSRANEVQDKVDYISTKERDANIKEKSFTEDRIISVRGKTKRSELEKESSSGNVQNVEDRKSSARSRPSKPLTRIPSKSKSPVRISRRSRVKHPESVAAHGLTPIRAKKKHSPKYARSPGMHMIDKRKRSRSKQMWPLSDAEEDSLTTFEATQVRAAIRVASRQRQLQLREAAAAAARVMRRADDGPGAAKARKTK